MLFLYGVSSIPVFCYTKAMRLDKLLFEAGFGSRNQVKKLIRSRQVLVDGRIVQVDHLIVDSSLQDIRVAGKQVKLAHNRYYLLNKPSGVVTAVSDKKHRTVLDLIVNKDKVRGLYPVGRLDRDTEGLILITNNGPLGFRMLHPRYHVSKTYYVEVNGLLSVDAPNFFENGIAFHDGTICKPAKLEIISSSPEKSCASLTISEGKFHQVKKMFLAYGVKVTYLKRTRFGPFELEEELPRGAYRTLKEDEIERLKEFFD